MEKIIYKTFGDPGKETNLCLHIYFTSKSNNKAMFFMNPLFDEKKRSQKFQNNIARAFNDKGYTVVRFDYSGTGDSYGDYKALTVSSILRDGKDILNFIFKEISIRNISILGIRFGASLAVKLASEYKEIDTIFLIDPIFLGKRYLSELRLRRKAFYMLNNMKKTEEKIIIDGNEFEDHQGYLMSDSLIDELMGLNVFNIKLNDKSVFLFSLDLLNAKKMLKLKEDLMETNKVTLIKDKTSSFWNTMEMTKTKSLETEILKYV